jgi:hypothetical protein
MPVASPETGFNHKEEVSLSGLTSSLMHEAFPFRDDGQQRPTVLPSNRYLYGLVPLARGRMHLKQIAM